MKRFTSLFHRTAQLTGEQICRYCNASIIKSSGFWALWRATKVIDDPEYCPSPAGHHAHRPI